MTLSKREFAEEAWIHISKRLPNGGMTDIVFCYNSKTGYFSAWPALIANECAEAMLNSNTQDISWDRQFTHWMPCYPPKDGITYAEYCEQQSNNKSRRRT